MSFFYKGGICIKPNYRKQAEAILYLWSDGLTEKQILQALQITPLEWNQIVTELEQKYSRESSGIVLSRHGDTWQFTTHPELHDVISGWLPLKPQKNLSQQALEVLAIIAYQQPVTKLAVEQIRGVQSSSVFETLLSRDLIREAGRLETIGKPFVYETTDEFLRYFSLRDLSDLPPLPETEDAGED